MSASIGANAQLFVDGYNVTGFFSEFSIEATKDVLDATVFGLGSRSKILGLKHAKVSGVAFYDDTAITGSYDIFKSKFPSGTAGTFAFAPNGFALGNQVFSLYSEEVTFHNTFPVGGIIMITPEAEALSDAVDMGVSLHALTAETTFPFTGTAVDNLASTSNGGVATLHVPLIAGGAPNVVYKIQHAAVATYADLVTFTAVTTANSFQRVVVAPGTLVNRNLRITITNGGTTSSVTGVVNFARR